MRPVAGEVILVTGATDGLGRGVAGELARNGAEVLVHGRDARRVEGTTSELGDAAGGSYRADFSSLGEVRAMAERVLSEQGRIDVLVNNAGVGSTLPGDGERLTSQDGYELRFAVNYLAGFLLTGLLEPLLTRSPPARVVNVSSAGQMPIDFDDVMLERHYNGTRAYCQSKLAQVMHTFDLAERLANRGVTANCLHPATYMPTKIVLHARGTAASSLEEGVRATTHLVVDPELEGVTGRYFDGLREARADAQAYDPEARRRLRELSEQLVADAIGPLETRRA
jgi:NAD(P)-dependent dehydrogenase (short-subunit alcohol dehydrogenase family)